MTTTAAPPTERDSRQDWVFDLILALLALTTVLAPYLVILAVYAPGLAPNNLVIAALLGFALSASVVLRRHRPDAFFFAACALSILHCLLVPYPFTLLILIPAAVHAVARFTPSAAWTLAFVIPAGLAADLRYYFAHTPSAAHLVVALTAAVAFLGVTSAAYAIGRRGRDLELARSAELARLSALTPPAALTPSASSPASPGSRTPSAASADPSGSRTPSASSPATPVPPGSTPAVIPGPAAGRNPEPGPRSGPGQDTMPPPADGGDGGGQPARPGPAASATLASPATARGVTGQPSSSRVIPGPAAGRNPESGPRSGPGQPAQPDPALIGGQPDGPLTALPELCRAAGAGLTVTGKPQPVGDDLALVIFQIVEEALTNVLRHAGRDAGPEVYLDWGDQDVELSVTNAPTGRPARPPQDRPAQGLDRIAAQAQSVDGQLETGPSPDGGFSVWARLPYTAGEEADRAATA